MLILCLLLYDYCLLCSDCWVLAVAFVTVLCAVLFTVSYEHCLCAPFNAHAVLYGVPIVCFVCFYFLLSL